MVQAKPRGENTPDKTTAAAAAQRQALHRAALLRTPIHTYATLAEMRGTNDAAERARIMRHRAAGDVIIVKHAGRAVIPAFQLTGDGEVRDDVARVNRLLAQDARLTGWEMWTWWQARTGLLSGESPIDTIDTTVGRVETAARRFSEQTV